ncbi:MAG: hypothetical protein H7Y37_19845 [Anaerolineae bacterium]|nr:hypothetical protein [Gloeobacterales cyanobacterium ES-bin-313]
MVDSKALTKRPEVQETLPAEAEIHTARTQLAQTSKQIGEQIKTKLSWRAIIQRYPLLVTGIAFGAGAVLGFGTVGGEKLPRPRKKASSGTTNKPGALETAVSSIAVLAVREGSKYLVNRLLTDKK